MREATSNAEKSNKTIEKISETNGEISLASAKTVPSPRCSRPPKIPSAELGRVFLEPLGPPPVRRPTQSVKAVDPKDLQQIVLSTFKKFKHANLDMEALIYFVLQSFEFQPDEYVGMHRMIREHIMKHLEIYQSGPLRLRDVSMYRLTVCCPDETDV